MIHVKVWMGTDSVNITDMENAGKRGKLCRVAQFRGWSPVGGGDEGAASRTLSCNVRRWAQDLPESTPFLDALATLREMVAAANLPSHCAQLFDDETIRGIDAPREPLTAGLPGVWAATAKEDGLVLDDLSDKLNEPAAITHGQAGSRAYSIARKVWPAVQACNSFYEACRTLGDAGCKLHSYCRMD